MTGSSRTLLAVGMVLAACGGGTPKPARPTTQAPTAVDPCKPVYAEYEQLWGAALAEDLTAMSATMTRAEVDEIVESQVATLPEREELVKLRTTYAVVDLFVPDAPWPRAFAAADKAIASCGEGAVRPRS